MASEDNRKGYEGSSRSKTPWSTMNIYGMVFCRLCVWVTVRAIVMGKRSLGFLRASHLDRSLEFCLLTCLQAVHHQRFHIHRYRFMLGCC
jgi:hypothetical protein